MEDRISGLLHHCCKNILQEEWLLLRSMPPGVNMDMGKGYDDNDRLRCSSLS